MLNGCEVVVTSSEAVAIREELSHFISFFFYELFRKIIYICALCIKKGVRSTGGFLAL